MFKPIGSLLAATVITLSLTGNAFADDAWQKAHPRREQVNNRLARQNQRIHQERKEGELTGAQAADLHAEDRGIRAQERFDASQNGGHITKAEQAQLNHEENGVSQQIGH